MTDNVLFAPVKEWGQRKETFIEHAIKTYHVGKYLHTRLKLDLDRKKYLYACFFHDVGKLLIKLGEGAHTPRSQEGLDLVKSTDAYQALLENFELVDYAGDEDVLASIEKHHNSDDEFSAFVAIADQVASSSSNDDLKNRLKKRAISSLVTYLNEMHGFGSTNFFFLEIPSFSKNELNAIGRLLLLKLLYETIEGLDGETHLLYETVTGCRVATLHTKQALKSLVSSAFSANLADFIRKQDLSKFIRGAPDGYKQFCTLPIELKPELERLTVLKYAQDIVKALKRYNVQHLEEVGLDEDVLLRFSNLSELKQLSGSTSSIKYALLADTDNRYPQWVIDAFKLKRVEVSAHAGKPVLDELLKEAGADTEKITRKEIVYPKICSLAKAISSIQSCEVEFRANVSDYLTIDGGGRK
jgi:HD domain